MPRLSKIGAACLSAFGFTTGASAVTASYLVVAGGAGGSGAGGGGGGGAGGLLTGTTSLSLATSYTVIVGAGGSAASPATGNAGSGSSSTFNSISTAGGGGGGASTGIAGGSGGGSGGSAGALSGGAGNTPSTSPSQGNNGGGTPGYGNPYYPAGGGGGAGAVGGSASGANTPGNGGNGVASSISGASVTYAGGGGGGSAGSNSTGGTGGGGAGSGSGAGTNGTANLGGGGGGGNGGSTTGGSGVVIISYAGAQQFGGGIVTSVGGNTIHTFTTSGTLSPISPLTANALIVAGGGGGSFSGGGGGGAGGLLSSSGIGIDANSIYLVTVGAGGIGVSSGTATSGTNSSFSMVTTTAVGGGYGGSGGNVGVAGGSAGGSGNSNGTVVSPSPAGQGNAGGGGGGAGQYGGGGGGGATGAGVTGASGGAVPNPSGGAGTASSISGSSVTYAGGGGGGHQNQSGVVPSGGAGGGGNGATSALAATSGTANTGGGGGGGGSTGANGGSGVVIISYAGSVQQMAGGTVTISGGNVIHTFTSSGYLAPIDLVGNSLRFRSSATASLTRTPTVASNLTTWTWSAWVKRGKLGANQAIFGANNLTTSETRLLFVSDDTILFDQYISSTTSFYLRTTQVFRDPAAWYHIVIVSDTTQATASNRIKLYVNGVQITAFSTATYPSQNQAGWVNNAYLQYIGNNADSYYYDGYQTEVNLIDGQALTPNSFGTFNSYGVWQPITYGGSYGTNGFYLPFNSGTTNYVGSFNGSNQSLNTPSSSNLALNADFTMEAWICPTTSSGTRSLIVCRGSFANSTGYAFGINTSNNLFVYTASGFVGTSSTALTSNIWSHVALVRSGSTNTFYINGTASGTFTNSNNYSDPSTNPTYIGANNSSAEYFTGFISNLRIVKGTAVYTSNFVPSTSSLSAISGTQLLTLQNATIIDNSTNAFTITNNNTVTTALNYPFSAAKIFNDQSPQGNNWTPNNISGASGFTLDYMTDVPTLTSATVANYCVLNPLDTAGGLTANSGNLNTTSTSNLQQIASTFGMSTGKWYYEQTVVARGGSASIGIGGSPKANSYVGDATDQYGYFAINGSKYNNSAGVAYGATYTTGDIIGVAYDADAGSLTFYKNGTSQGVAFTGITGTMFALVDGRTSGGTSQFALNFGQRPFSYTAPSGFLALNTYNI